MLDLVSDFDACEPFNEPRQQFVRMLPTIRRRARTAAKHLPCNRRDEFVQDVMAAAYALFHRLVERKLTTLAYPNSLATYAIARVRSGRCVGIHLNSRDVMSLRARQTHRFAVTSLEADFDDYSRTLRDTLVDTKRFSPAEAAAFRLDFQTWLTRLPARKRAIVWLLVRGESTSETAQLLGVTDARISQVRRLLQTDWETFQGEPIGMSR